MLDVIASPSSVNVLGRLGENEHRRMLFDISEYVKQYPGASFGLLNRRPGDDAAYPVPRTQVNENYLYWTVTSADLTKNGAGYCEFIVTFDGVIAKSVIYMTEVLTALDGSGEAPEPWASWQSWFLEMAEQASSSASYASESASNAASSAQSALVSAQSAGDSADSARASAHTAEQSAGSAEVSAQRAQQSAADAAQYGTRVTVVGTGLILTTNN